MSMTLEELLFLNGVARDIREMNDGEQIIARLDKAKEEYAELLDSQDNK